MAYYLGEGVEQDEEEGVRLFRQAAEQGHGDAQYWLGQAYCQGKGAGQDISEGLKWLMKAAEQGNENAVNALNTLNDGE